jgi:long-subunit acyl-CoA synthetase (AMP-forming)
VSGKEIPSLEEQLGAILEQSSDTLVRSEEYQDFEDQSNNIALILSSSGSTGLPKGVALSNRNVVAALMSR